MQWFDLSSSAASLSHHMGFAFYPCIGRQIAVLYFQVKMKERMLRSAPSSALKLLTSISSRYYIHSERIFDRVPACRGIDFDEEFKSIAAHATTWVNFCESLL